MVIQYIGMINSFVIIVILFLYISHYILHISFAGIGSANLPIKTLINNIHDNKKVLERWQRTIVLIIDEISMIRSDLFTKLDEIARIVRSCDKPFGGIQVINCRLFNKNVINANFFFHHSYSLLSQVISTNFHLWLQSMIIGLKVLEYMLFRQRYGNSQLLKI